MSQCLCPKHSTLAHGLERLIARFIRIRSSETLMHFFCRRVQWADFEKVSQCAKAVVIRTRCLEGATDLRNRIIKTALSPYILPEGLLSFCAHYIYDQLRHVLESFDGDDCLSGDLVFESILLECGLEFGHHWVSSRPFKRGTCSSSALRPGRR